MNRLNILTLLFLFIVTSCSTNPNYDSSKAHHTQDGFKNINYDDDNKGFLKFIKWRWQKLFKDIPGADDYNFTIDTTHHEFVKSNTEQSTLTWIGHATFLIQFHGLNILTDPQFSERASPVSWAGPERVVAPGMGINDMPDIDVVIISHDHYDSLDVTSVIALSEHNREKKITFIVPLGMKQWFEELNLKSINVVELDWTQHHEINGVRFIAEPSQHWGKRTLADAYERLWASWVIEASDNRLFFAGDTGYANHFKNIGNKYGGFDIALLPIGAYEPRWFLSAYHVYPEEAVRIHMDIRARHSVAMHWGTFILTDEPLDEPPVKLAEALKKYAVKESDFQIYQHGETRFLDDLL